MAGKEKDRIIEIEDIGRNDADVLIMYGGPQDDFDEIADLAEKLINTIEWEGSRENSENAMRSCLETICHFEAG